MKTNKRRLNGEKKIVNDSFKLKFGTTNKTNPEAIYFIGNTFISPMYEKKEYDDEINSIFKSFRLNLNNRLKNDQYFNSKYILDFSVPTKRISYGKKSFLSFQILLRQKSMKPLRLDELKNYASEFINGISFDLENDIDKYEFVLSKTK